MGERLLAQPARVDGRAGYAGELDRAGNKVGVDVGFEDGDNREIALGRPIEVDLDVPPRIDNGDLPRGLVGHEVGNLRQTGRKDAIDDQGAYQDCAVPASWVLIETKVGGVPRKRSTASVAVNHAFVRQLTQEATGGTLKAWVNPTSAEEVSMAKSAAHATVDEKGRILIPDAVRKQLGIEAGDVMFLQVEEETGVLRYAKAENPFDLLAEHALRESRAGRTRTLREIAAEEGVDLDAN